MGIFADDVLPLEGLRGVVEVTADPGGLEDDFDATILGAPELVLVAFTVDVLAGEAFEEGCNVLSLLVATGDLPPSPVRLSPEVTLLVSASST